MGQSIGGCEVLFKKDSTGSLYLNDVMKIKPLDYQYHFDDFDKVEFTLIYRLTKESPSGLQSYTTKNVAHFIQPFQFNNVAV